MLSKELKLVDGESENPGNDVRSDGEGVVMFWDEGHVLVLSS